MQPVKFFLCFSESMGSQRKGIFQPILVNMGLMVIAAIVLVSLSGSFASAYVVPQASDADVDGDRRIEILRRSDANGEGMDEALKYLEELDKYYAQVARPRYVFHISFSILTKWLYHGIYNILALINRFAKSLMH